MKKKLAVFDIDGTIFRSSLLIELMNGLIDNKVFSKSVNTQISKQYNAWLNREGVYGDYLARVINVYEKNIKGCNEKEVEAVVATVINKEKKKLYIYTRDLIQRLKRNGYFLFAISGSPGHILTSFAKEIGFDKYLGGYYEVVDGKFTGKQPYGNPSQDKKKTLEDFLKKGYADFDLENSVGVGDTESDIPFLEIIGHPIAFNPNRGLAEYAKKNKWKIVVERKDVIYDIFESDFINGD